MISSSSSSSSSCDPPSSKKPKLDKKDEDKEEVVEDARSVCPFGLSCYRKNPIHFKEFKHEHLETLYISITSANAPLEDYSKFKEAETFTNYNKSQLIDQLKLLRVIGFHHNHTSTNKHTHNNNHNAAAPDDDKTTTTTDKKKKPGGGGNMLDKWNASAPYYFFLTKLTNELSSPHVVSFKELFDPSFGQVQSILHFNFMIEFQWLLDQSLAVGLEGVDLSLIYDVQTPELRNAPNIFPWIKTYKISSPFPYGHHHSKLSLIKYQDGSLRFIVSTANLIQDDWDKRTQGIWISPACHRITNSSNIGAGESCTNFRADLVQYLRSYPSKHVTSWIQDIQNADCSQIKVALIASAPVTTATSTNGFEWGSKKLEKCLKSCLNPNISPDWPLILQCSSIGSLGPSDDWLRAELSAKMCPTNKIGSTKIPIHVIYPSHSNVLDSFDGVHGGGCLPYSYNTHSKQLWFINYLYQWKSSGVVAERNRAVPHIKCYARLSPDFTRLAWFVLSSANLSKAAWGKLNKAGNKLNVMSWEVGVAFIPKYFDVETFEVVQTKDDLSTPGKFKLPFDVPPIKYGAGDRPWIIEALLAAQNPVGEGDDDD